MDSILNNMDRCRNTGIYMIKGNFVIRLYILYIFHYGLFLWRIFIKIFRKTTTTSSIFTFIISIFLLQLLFTGYNNFLAIFIVSTDGIRGIT